jgi:DNA-binding MarR family transcriptional regulator
MTKVASSQQEAWGLMLELFMAQRGKMLSVAQEFGLHPQQAMALNILQPGEPLKLSDLATKLHCDNSNVTGIADRLEAAGLAERRPHPSDRRVKTLSLTERGEHLRGLHRERMGTAPPGIAALTDADAAALVEILQRAKSA